MASGIAGAASNYVARQHMLADQVAPRLAWYGDLWARRKALSAALRMGVHFAGFELGRGGGCLRV